MSKLFYKTMLLFFMLIYLVSCNTAITHAQNNTISLPKISNKKEFNEFAGYPLDNTFSEVGSIKIIYDIHAKQLYYINTHKYELHYEFCENELNYNLGLGVFNATNYSNNIKRDYYLANLNYFKNSDVYALEFFADNEMTPDQLNFLFHKIEETFFDKKKLKLFLNNENINEIYEKCIVKIPTITIDEIYKNQQYQYIQPGSCVGFVKIIDSSTTFQKENLTDKIIIIKGTPLEMPICKGFISTEFQTPLSHIQVLAHHRNIPTAAYKKCLIEYAKYNNKPVRMIVNRGSISFEILSNEDYEKYFQKSKKNEPIKIVFDSTIHKILPINEVNKQHRISLGAKAYNFAFLQKLATKKSYFFTPESAYAIPYSFYQTHIQTPKINSEIAKLESMQEANQKDLNKQLKKIRQAILETPINKNLLNDISAKLISSNYKTFRFRSSCNAEDLANFSGAGLYDSYTGILNDSIKTIELAIKKVWASTYNYRAYIERNQFGIDEKTVRMGILVHRSFPDEKSNGVVITKNIYRDDYPAYVINVQQGDVSVVNPPKNVVCDQIICSSANLINPLSNKLAIKYVSKSTLTNGKTVLTIKEIQQLFTAIEFVSQNFHTAPYIDVEFKFDKNGKLYLKQVRPYK